MSQVTSLRVTGLPGGSRAGIPGDAALTSAATATASFVTESFFDADLTAAGTTTVSFVGPFTQVTGLSLTGLPRGARTIDAGTASGTRIFGIPFTARVDGTLSDFDIHLDVPLFADVEATLASSISLGSFLISTGVATVEFYPEITLSAAGTTTVDFRTPTEAVLTSDGVGFAIFHGESSASIFVSGVLSSVGIGAAAFVTSAFSDATLTADGVSTATFDYAPLHSATLSADGMATVDFATNQEAAFSAAGQAFVLFVAESGSASGAVSAAGLATATFVVEPLLDTVMTANGSTAVSFVAAPTLKIARLVLEGQPKRLSIYRRY